MGKRVEFLKRMRTKASRESFEDFLGTMDPDDVTIIRHETAGVLCFMKLRDVAFEDFPDLLENRLRIIWDMSWK